VQLRSALTGGGVPGWLEDRSARRFRRFQPPYSDDIYVYNLRRLIECIDKFAHRVTSIVSVLNMSKINWLTLTSPNDEINRLFLDSMVEHGFSQFVTFPTLICYTILDNVLADDDQIINQVKVGLTAWQQ